MIGLPYAAELVYRIYAGRTDSSGAAPQNALRRATKGTTGISDAPSHPLGRMLVAAQLE